MPALPRTPHAPCPHAQHYRSRHTPTRPHAHAIPTPALTPPLHCPHALTPPAPTLHAVQVRMALVTRNTTASVDAFFRTVGQQWRSVFDVVRGGMEEGGFCWGVYVGVA